MRATSPRELDTLGRPFMMSGIKQNFDTLENMMAEVDRGGTSDQPSIKKINFLES